MVLFQTLVIININAAKPRLRMEINMPNTNSEKTVDEKSVFNDMSDELLKKGKFFRDLFSEQLSEHEIEFGHVCENPNEWEQRFERKDMGKNSYQGKVKWGNKNGDYGEHYWDLNH